MFLRVFVVSQGGGSDVERSKKKRRGDRYSVQTSLIVAALKKMLPIGLNMCSPADQELINLAKTRYALVEYLQLPEGPLHPPVPMIPSFSPPSHLLFSVILIWNLSTRVLRYSTLQSLRMSIWLTDTCQVFRCVLFLHKQGFW